MRGAMIVALLLSALLAGPALAQSKIELKAADVEEMDMAETDAVGFVIGTTMTSLPQGRELISAMLWLELSTAKEDNEGALSSRGCVAVVPLADDADLASAAPIGEYMLPLGETRTACFDITSLVRERLALPTRELRFAVVPCAEETAIAELVPREGAAVVGWIECSFFDRAKLQRLMGE